MRRFFDRTASDKQVAEAFELTDTRGWRISDERWPMRIDLGRDRR
jgi:hypothetical protein